MNTPIIVLVIALVLGVGTYTLYARPQSPAAPETQPPTSPTDHADSGHTQDGMSMDEHKRLMDDGETLMAMNNEISPAVVYARPGQELTFASHEPFPVQLKTTDGAHMTQLANPGDPHSTFTAPVTPGRYEFLSSHDASVKAVVIVEE